ncbi:MAG: hypothetical protein IKO41_15810 [Lachnospiraceae bacterium]|nr:hypothetical protein [Lachnospiraceae bacterium]
MPQEHTATHVSLEKLNIIAKDLNNLASNPAMTMVVQSPEDLPERIQKDLGGNLTQSAGVYDPETDAVFLVADNVHSPEEAAIVWTHEQVVHHGLRSLLSPDDRNDLLDTLWLKSGGLNNEDMSELSLRYGVDPEDTDSRRFLCEEYLACLAEKRSSDLLSGSEKSLWGIVVDAVKRAVEKICEVVTGKKDMGVEPDSIIRNLGRHVIEGKGSPMRGAVVSETARPALRTAPDPQQTITAYKLFRVEKDNPGKLFPLFVKADESVPMGVWVDAEIGPQAAPSKSGRKQVKAKKGKLAFRPGWHVGDAPCMYQVGTGKLRKRKVNGEKVWQREQREGNHVWAEVKVAADISYQAEADQNGINPKTGKFVNRDADIKRIPEDGYYRYKTSPTMKGKWIISGSMKVERVLTDREVESINSKTGWPDLPRSKPLVLEEWGFDHRNGQKLGEIREKDEVKETLQSYCEHITEHMQQQARGTYFLCEEKGTLFEDFSPKNMSARDFETQCQEQGIALRVIHASSETRDLAHLEKDVTEALQNLRQAENIDQKEHVQEEKEIEKRGYHR